MKPKIIDDYGEREMTGDDIRKLKELLGDSPLPPPDPIQEQIEELQAAVIELAAMQTGGA